ncbi:MAG: hypothetical protein ABIH36_00205 [bacterium]
MGNIQAIEPTQGTLSEVFRDDKALALFFNEWFENGGNASKAYIKLHPHVTKQSARVLGARQLAKVSVSDLLAVGGFTAETYMRALSDGLGATKSVYYREVPDYVTRFKYFLVFGRLLGIDKGSSQVNIFNAMQQNVKK